MVSELAQNAKVNYGVPRVLEASISILAHQVRSGERLFNDNPLTHTSCLEKVHGYQIIVGDFKPSRLNFTVGFYDSIGIGVAALRKFQPLVVG